MVIEVVTIHVAAGDREDVLRTFRRLCGPLEADVGCMRCRILQDTEQETRLTLVLHWRTWEDLERHVKSDSYRWLLATMELSTEPPEVAFHIANQTSDMALVEMLRGHAARSSRRGGPH